MHVGQFVSRTSYSGLWCVEASDGGQGGRQPDVLVCLSQVDDLCVHPHQPVLVVVAA